MKLTQLWFTGMIISLLSSLPLGTLNVATFQISFTEGYVPAVLFAVGCFFAEVCYAIISLVLMDKIIKHIKAIKILELLTLAVMVLLAASYFTAALKNSTHSENIFLSIAMPRLFLGFLMTAMNPVQLPFWLGWNTILLTKKILLPKIVNYRIYIVGIGTGTLLASGIFIFIGRMFVDNVTLNQHILNWILAGIFTLTAAFQIWKIIGNKRDAKK